MSPRLTVPTRLDAAAQRLHTAFSREQDVKVYVQHRMAEQSEEVWKLISSAGAHVYIAGAANQMPKAVRRELRQAAMRHGQLDEEAADAFLSKLEAEGRLQCETW